MIINQIAAGGGNGADNEVVVALAFPSQSSSSVTTTYKSFTAQIRKSDTYKVWDIGTPESLEFVGLFFGSGMHRTFDMDGQPGNGWVYRNSSQTTLGNGIGSGYYAKGAVPATAHMEGILNGTAEECIMGETEIPGYDNGFQFLIIIDSVTYDYNAGNPIITVNYREKEAVEYTSSTSRGHNGRFVIMAKIKVP